MALLTAVGVGLLFCAAATPWYHLRGDEGDIAFLTADFSAPFEVGRWLRWSLIGLVALAVGAAIRPTNGMALGTMLAAVLSGGIGVRLIWVIYDQGLDTRAGMVFACAGWLVLVGTYAIPAWAGWPWSEEFEEPPLSGNGRSLVSETVLRVGFVAVLVGLVLLGVFAFGV